MLHCVIPRINVLHFPMHTDTNPTFLPPILHCWRDFHHPRRSSARPVAETCPLLSRLRPISTELGHTTLMPVLVKRWMAVDFGKKVKLQRFSVTTYYGRIYCENCEMCKHLVLNIYNPRILAILARLELAKKRIDEPTIEYVPLMRLTYFDGRLCFQSKCLLGTDFDTLLLDAACFWT